MCKELCEQSEEGRALWEQWRAKRDNWQAVSAFHREAGLAAIRDAAKVGPCVVMVCPRDGEESAGVAADATERPTTEQLAEVTRMCAVLHLDYVEPLTSFQARLDIESLSRELRRRQTQAERDLPEEARNGAE
jgi:hypothetical protein